ncbi:MAG: pilin [Gammaproteobacteria bacterium]
MNKHQHAQSGFTLLELMITIAIIGILAAIAVPSYMSYVQKARFSEIVTAATQLKPAIATCAQLNGSLANCQNGINGIPAAITNTGNIASLKVTDDGVITGVSRNLATNYTYILTPTLQTNGTITWVDTGTCKVPGIC